MNPPLPPFETIHARIDQNLVDGAAVTRAGCAVLSPETNLDEVWAALSLRIGQKRWTQERVIWYWRAPALVASDQEAHWVALTPWTSRAGNQLGGLLRAAGIAFAECRDGTLDPASVPVLKWSPPSTVVRLWRRDSPPPPEDAEMAACEGVRLHHRLGRPQWDDRSHARPAYFTRLTLDHVRCFGSPQTLHLMDTDGRLAPWTLLLGENGVGKTTVLQCLAWMRPQVRVGNKGKGVGIQGAISDWENVELRALARSTPSGSYELECQFAPEGTLGSCPDRFVHTSAKVSFVGSDLSDEGTNVEGGSRGACPDIPLVYYGAGRFVGSKNLGEPRLKDAIGSLRHGRTEMYDPEEVLREFDAEATKAAGAGGRRARALLDRVLWLLVDLLPDLEQPSHIEIARPGLSGPTGGPAGIRFRTPYGWVSLEDLSFGYRTVLTWALDLSMRLVQRYEHHPDPLAAPAVVLVDEIDLHLHPRWQRDIREGLLQVFPAVQFIVTAHSPVMAQDAEGANIEVLRQEDGEVRVISNPDVRRGARLDQVMSGELFELPARSKATAAMIDRRRELRGRPTLTEVEALELAELDAKFAALPDAERLDDQRVMDALRLAVSTIGKAPGKHG